MTVRHFIFVEFTNPEVRNFLDELRLALSGKPAHDSPHITVRGPYSTKPEKSSIDTWKNDLHGHGVILIDIGTFKTPKGHVVFLHAKSKIFDEIWWKPDYKSPKNKRKPHLTLLETKSERVAQSVKDFLTAENISIFTFGVDLTVYTTKQRELLRSNASIINENYSPLPQERMVFKPGLFSRTKKFIKSLENQGNDQPVQRSLF